MIIRVVQMHFRPEAVAEIQQRLLEQAPKVRAFPGCLHLSLHCDAESPNTLYSISYWESPEALAAYRQSSLFRAFWAELKGYFSGPARAFTLQEAFLSLSS